MAQMRQWKVTLTLEGPIITQATSAGRLGFDAVMARTPDGTAWCLPGTHVKGKLRQAWEELATVCGFQVPVEDLLGLETGNQEDGGGGSVDPSRGTLQFTDFVCTSHPIGASPPTEQQGNVEAGEGDGAEQVANDQGQPPAGPADSLFRIRMDPDRGSVDRGAYLVIEAPFAVGAEVEFEGGVRTAGDKPSSTDLLRYLKKGFGWIPSFGAERTVGFGRVKAVAVEEVQTSDLSTQLAQADQWLQLEPLAPFCIAKRKVASNLFEAEEVIPGGVLKGSLAATWAQSLGTSPHVDPKFDSSRPELSEYFWAVRFTHAFPCGPDGKRPVVFPQSLVCCGTDVFNDAALAPQPSDADFAGTFGDDAPAFSVDWKDKPWGKVRGHFGWPDLKKDLRVRTAMDPVHRKGADEKLFACETVVPGDTRWAFKVDLSRVPDSATRQKVGNQLRDLLSQGLLGMGKTKAAARVRAGNGALRMNSDATARDGSWVVTLQTSALLGNPKCLNEKSDAADLREMYEAAWSDLSEQSLELVDYFARQTLAGGYYLHNKFTAKQKYRPYLLTEAGSVFVLKAKNGAGVAAEKFINDWLEEGLPRPAWVVPKGVQESEAWRHCPYLPENGYGEIAVNLPVHWGKDLPGGGENEQ